jgi:hypothetical protein
VPQQVRSDYTKKQLNTLVFFCGIAEHIEKGEDWNPLFERMYFLGIITTYVGKPLPQNSSHPPDESRGIRRNKIEVEIKDILLQRRRKDLPDSKIAGP